MTLRIAAVGRAVPQHYYDQQTLLEALEGLWAGRLHNPQRLPQLHRHVLVAGRHLALPLEEYAAIDSFAAANRAYIRCATELGAQALRDGLTRAALEPAEIDHLFFTSVTGIATPSIDARIVNRLRLKPEVKRTPLFGLGCVGGAAGVSRAADYLRAFPDQVAALVSVELCSLTLQREDVSIPNLIASGLFGDGSAAVLLVGSERAASHECRGPAVVASCSSFYPETEDVMGWEIDPGGFRVVLSAEVPDVVRRHIRQDVDTFLGRYGLARSDIGVWVSHPGGPRVLEALQEALELPQGALDLTWASLASLGNLSSASVLMVLRDALEVERQPGTWGLMLAMGPGFCSELVLLRW